MATITRASDEWATRPSDERFVSLPDMLAHFHQQRGESAEAVSPVRELICAATRDGLRVSPGDGVDYRPSHWAFGQLATLAQAPAGYLRTLPAAIAAAALNHGIADRPDDSAVGMLMQRNGSDELRALTGPRYGRIWNEDVVEALIRRFGDGVTGDFRVPGEFGRAAPVTIENTTLYGSDEDMFVFLADEQNRIEMPDRRDGKAGSIARGFFVWNSEVGAQTLGIGTFLFDYVCSNRIVWGSTEYQEIRLRHTSGAPTRYIDQLVPAIENYSRSSTTAIVTRVEAARQRKLDADRIAELLGDWFGRKLIQPIRAAHIQDEGRPIETLWDVTVGATAYARTIGNTNNRVLIERAAGDLLDLAV